MHLKVSEVIMWYIVGIAVPNRKIIRSAKACQTNWIKRQKHPRLLWVSSHGNWQRHHTVNVDAAEGNDETRAGESDLELTRRWSSRQDEGRGFVPDAVITNKLSRERSRVKGYAVETRGNEATGRTTGTMVTEGHYAYLENVKTIGQRNGRSNHASLQVGKRIWWSA